MQLYRATALIAVMLILILSAGYAAVEHGEPEQSSSLSSSDSGS